MNLHLIISRSFVLLTEAKIEREKENQRTKKEKLRAQNYLLLFVHFAKCLYSDNVKMKKKSG